MNREVEIDRFIARTDDGKEYVIVMYQEFLSTATHERPHDEIPGLKRLTTTTGLHVNYIDPSTFKVVQTDQVIRKVWAGARSTARGLGD
jgi:hypothetical protein